MPSTAATAAANVAKRAKVRPARLAAAAISTICQSAKIEHRAQISAGTTTWNSVTSPPLKTAIEMLPNPIRTAIAAHTPRK